MDLAELLAPCIAAIGTVSDPLRQLQVLKDELAKACGKLNGQAGGIDSGEVFDVIAASGPGHDLCASPASGSVRYAISDVLREHAANGHDEPEAITVVPLFPIVIANIPRRPWLVPGLFLRRQVSVLVAPPGSGKSLLTIQIGLMCCSHMSGWGGWLCPKQYRVLIINMEEDEDEMNRRAVVAAMEMGIEQSSIGDRFYIARAESIIIAKRDPDTKGIYATPVQEQVINAIKKHNIDLCIVDPFAETFDVEENNNSELKWAAILWRDVARATGCALWLVHHTKKYASGMAGDADASRGGGSLIGVARIISTLFGMTKEEAEANKIDEDARGRYVRFDDAKANQSMVSMRAKWFFKKSIVLENGDEEGGGDEVGVLVPWTPPEVFDGIDERTINSILDELEMGRKDDDGNPTGEYYGMHNSGKSNARWAGNAIKEYVDCTDKEAANMLLLWKKSGLIGEREGVAGRKKVKNIFVCNEKRPGRGGFDD